MKKVVKYSFNAIWANVRFLIYKLKLGSNFNYRIKSAISPFAELDFEKKTMINIGKNVNVLAGARIKVRKNSVLNFGNGVYIGNGSIIVSHKQITIGDDTTIGPNVSIFDHDHAFHNGLEKKVFQCSKIEIGKNVWIGANCVILRGSKIDDDCVIAAGTIVNGYINASTLVYDKREKVYRDINRSD